MRLMAILPWFEYLLIMFHIHRYYLGLHHNYIKSKLHVAIYSLDFYQACEVNSFLRNHQEVRSFLEGVRKSFLILFVLVNNQIIIKSKLLHKYSVNHDDFLLFHWYLYHEKIKYLQYLLLYHLHCMYNLQRLQHE